MILVSDILDNARVVLADANKSRWTDANLITLLNEGMSNFILTAGFNKVRMYIKLEPDVAIYNIADYAVNIDRIQYMNTPLIVESVEQFDKINPNWEDEVGTAPLYVTFDNLQQGMFRIYPKVNELTTDIVTQNQVFGGLIDISYTDEVQMLPNFDSIELGTTKYLVVNYTKKPIKVTAITDYVELNSTYLPAMSAYVSGQALRVNKDTFSSTLGEKQLGIYNSYLLTASKKESNSNNTSHIREIKYRGFQ